MPENESGAEKGSILVIDDDPLLRRTLQKVLEREGYFVDVAHDGHEGVRKARSGFFHLVICDIKMPGLDGLMTVERIKKIQAKTGEGYSGCLMITAYDTPETTQKAVRLGVTGFMRKPFDLDRILAEVNHQVDTLKPAKNSLAGIKQLNERLKMLINA